LEVVGIEDLKISASAFRFSLRRRRPAMIQIKAFAPWPATLIHPTGRQSHGRQGGGGAVLAA
jgi:hypothetical protein